MSEAVIKPLKNLIFRKPVLAILEICLRCNSQCGYCDLPLNQGRYEMSREEIARIFKDLYRDGVRFVLVQGGEPTLRKDLVEILQDLVNIGFGVTLVTNGTRLREPLVEQLRQLPVNISISLDTLDRQKYQRIRGADQLGMVLRGIERLQDYPHPKYITCIVSDENRAEAVDVARFARSKGFIPVMGAYHWDIERYGKVDPGLQYQKQAAVEVFEEVLESGLVPKGYFRRYVKDNISWLSGDGLASCDAGRYSISIDASGNVAPCLALEHAGNLREQSLAGILRQFDRQAVAECSNRSSCNMLCSRVVGSVLRHPLNAAMTPSWIPPAEL